MQSLISGLILAAISGISFIAYRHPAAYAQYAFWPFMAAMFFGLCGQIYNLGVSSGTSSQTKFIDWQKKAAAEKEGIKTNAEIPGWALLGLYLFAVYIFFLRFLPNILGDI